MGSNEYTSKCCPACAAAYEATGLPEGNVVTQPWVGVATKTLITGDVIRSFGRGPHKMAVVTVEPNGTFAQWEDQGTPERLRVSGGYTVIRRVRDDDPKDEMTLRALTRYAKHTDCSGAFQAAELRAMGYDATPNCHGVVCSVSTDLTVEQAIFLQAVTVARGK